MCLFLSLVVTPKVEVIFIIFTKQNNERKKQKITGVEALYTGLNVHF